MSKPKLPNVIGKFSALMIGLGSIIGTGAFISIGIAAGISEKYLLLSIILAFFLALCNGISSAQLAANHPVSGGTYEYGRKYLNNYLGFMAGWTFIFAKSASGAAAALTFGGYLSSIIGYDQNLFIDATAIIIVLIITIVLLFGVKRTTVVNNTIVFVSLASLSIFIILGIITFYFSGNTYSNLEINQVFSNEEVFKNVLYSTAIIFVAFTGYGRIATLGEEIIEPRKNIPIIIIITLFIAFILYSLIAMVSTVIVGYRQFSLAAINDVAPLITVAQNFMFKEIVWIVAIGAFFAIIGVLLNLVLGISRVIFAMGRNEDFPKILSNLSQNELTPIYAILTTSLIISCIVLVGDIKSVWSFSAFSVLIYYGITNYSAMRLSNNERFFPKVISRIGFFGCMIVAFYIEPVFVKIGILILLIGTAFFLINNKIKRVRNRSN